MSVQIMPSALDTLTNYDARVATACPHRTLRVCVAARPSTGKDGTDQQVIICCTECDQPLPLQLTAAESRLLATLTKSSSTLAD